MQGEPPQRDVHGHMVVYCPVTGVGDAFEYRVRAYAGGHGRVDIDGVAYPIPATMTAMQYFEMVFAARLRPDGHRRAVGD